LSPQYKPSCDPKGRKSSLLDLQLYIDKFMISVIFTATVQHGAYAYHIVLAKIVQIGFLTWQSEDLHILSVFFIQIYLSYAVQ
jgi:hypothetical protein